MKQSTLAVLAFIASTSVASWLPSCAWSNCISNWQPGSCSSSSPWDCLCGNSTVISQINTCVASACSNATDQEAIYAAVAQLCVNNGHTITNSPEATFSATSGGSLGPTVTGGPGPWGGRGPNGWQSGDWSSWLSAASTAIGGGWGSWGPGGPGPYRYPGAVCQPSNGWTASWGSWTSDWTWTHCTGTGTAITTIPTTMVMTVTTGGVTSVMTTATNVAVQAQAQVAAASTTASGNLAVSANSGYLAAYGGAAAAAFGIMLAL